MRKPTENGLASICTPRRCSIAKVSRALWPSASTTWSARVARRWPAPGRARESQGPLPATSIDQKVGHLLAEADLAAQRLDLGAHLLDHADQAEGADVRLGHVEDLLGRAGLDELGQHLARQVARVADLAPQLAVAEGAGAAFAELHVRLGVSTPWRHRPQVSLVRSRTALPRSSTIGRSPICASTSAAKMPQGRSRPPPGAAGPRARSPPARWPTSGSGVGRGRMWRSPASRPAAPPRRRPARSRRCRSARWPTSCARPRRGGRP
jgi:hypothetical protein